LRTLFPEVLGARIDTPRREVFLFGPPAGDARFSWPNLPVFSEATYYGFPDFDHRGLKVCPVGGVVEMDPDSDERVVTPHYVRRAHEYVARRFPAMRGQPVIETRVCQLENTADEHFVIDRHPDFDNVWLAGGGSGHGFKHGPVLGEYIAARALGRPTSPEYDALFALAPGAPA
jgi:sarcosine oxidase